MSMNTRPERIERLPSRGTLDALDDSVVLRLSRTSLKADPPEVRFVERVAAPAGQQRMLWPA